MEMTPTGYGEAVAAEVRAGMARRNHRITDLAEVLGVTPATASSRFYGKTPFDVVELAVVAEWLGISIDRLAAVDAVGGAA